MGAHAGSPRLVAWLQRRGVILSREAHREHHASPYVVNYCIATGWCNAWLTRRRVFARLERTIFRVTGMLPRADEEPFAADAARDGYRGPPLRRPHETHFDSACVRSSRSISALAGSAAWRRPRSVSLVSAPLPASTIRRFSRCRSCAACTRCRTSARCCTWCWSGLSRSASSAFACGRTRRWERQGIGRHARGGAARRLAGSGRDGVADGPNARIMGLDWFLLNMIVYSAVFIPLERLFAQRPEQSTFRAAAGGPIWRTSS